MVLYARVVRGRRGPPHRVLREPAAEPLVNRRVIEQAQVVETPHVAAVLGLERDGSAAPLPRSAAVGDEEVADRASGASRAVGERRRDEAVGRGIEEPALPAAVAQELVRIAVAPVLLQAAAEPKVLDPRAATVQEEVGE